MQINYLLFYMFLAVGVFNIIHFGLYLTGANIYDIWQFRRQRHLPKRYHCRRPLVSVIIPAHNEEKAIERCLESVRRSSYRKIEVIVHDDISTDNTARLVRAYQNKHPKFQLRLVQRRHHVGKAGGINYCAKRYAKGELIMTLDADSILRRDAIKNVVSYFKDPKIVGVAANVMIIEEPTILGILQKFEHMIGYRSKKFYTVTNSEFIVGGVASTYRHEVLKQVKFYDTDTQTEDIGLSMKIVALGNKTHKIVYASDVVAMTEGVQTFKSLLRQRYRWKMGSLQNLLKYRHLFGNRGTIYSKLLTFYRVPVAFFSEILLILEPLIWTYIIYLSILIHSPTLFVGAYMTITIYVLWTLWPDEHMSLIQKARLSFYAPLLYFMFYIMSFVQIISVFRCIFNINHVARRTIEGGKWTSPERRGVTV